MSLEKLESDKFHKCSVELKPKSFITYLCNLIIKNFNC